jgi:hypothetical protein
VGSTGGQHQHSMTLASPAGVVNSSSIGSSSTIRGRILLLVLAVSAVCAGPYVSWRAFLLLWPLRWTILASIAAVEACFYRCVLCDKLCILVPKSICLAAKHFMATAVLPYGLAACSLSASRGMCDAVFRPPPLPQSFHYLLAYAKHSRIPQPCMPQGYSDHTTAQPAHPPIVSYAPPLTHPFLPPPPVPPPFLPPPRSPPSCPPPLSAPLPHCDTPNAAATTCLPTQSTAASHSPACPKATQTRRGCACSNDSFE